MPALMAVISADANPMRRELAAVKQMSRQAGRDMEAGLAGSGGIARAGALREVLVLMREISRGNWTRVPGSLTILLDRLGLLKLVFRDTAGQARVLASAMQQKAEQSALAAIAAKEEAAQDLATASAMTKVTEAELAVVTASRQKAAAALAAADADRAAAVAAAESAAAMEAEGAAATLSLGPIGWIVAAIVALSIGTYALVRHFRTLAKETQNLRDLMNATRGTFTTQADAIKHAADEARAFVDWLNELGEAQEGVAQKTEDALRIMREQARMEHELAQQRGAGKTQLDAMDVAEAQKELAYIQAAQLTVNQSLAKDRADAIAAEGAANNPDRAADLENATKHAQFAGKIVDAIAADLDSHQGRGHATRAIMPVAVEVDGKQFRMTYQEAQANFKKLSDEEAALAETQRQLNDALKQKKKATDKDVADQERLSRQANELSADIELRKKYDPLLRGHGRGGNNHLTENQQIGAFNGLPGIAETGRKQLSELKKLHAEVRKLNRGGFRPMERNY